MQGSRLDELQAAVCNLAQRSLELSDELISINLATGRILSQPLIADRDSPASDISAMDGYAFNLTDLRAIDGNTCKMQVCGVACAGEPRIALEPFKAVRIFTGACVPVGANCIVPREETGESEDQVELRIPLDSLRPGQHIRRRGENSAAGAILLPAGTEITTATIGTLASFGKPTVPVRRNLRVAILNSGNELIPPGEAVEDWQIRDSNGPTLRSWINNLRWVTLVYQARIKDDLASSVRALQKALDTSDLVIISGGVSAGDTDFIPNAVVQLGGQIVFHRLPIKPGRPVMGAVLGHKLIVCLPGNPLSAAVTARVIAQPLMERLASRLPRPSLQLRLANPDTATHSLVWYRLIRLDEGIGHLVDSRGSGDFVSMARSDGFIQVPPGLSGSGPWQAWLW